MSFSHSYLPPSMFPPCAFLYFQNMLKYSFQCQGGNCFWSSRCFITPSRITPYTLRNEIIRIVVPHIIHTIPNFNISIQFSHSGTSNTSRRGTFCRTTIKRLVSVVILLPATSIAHLAHEGRDILNNPNFNVKLFSNHIKVLKKYTEIPIDNVYKRPHQM